MSTRYGALGVMLAVPGALWAATPLPSPIPGGLTTEMRASETFSYDSNPTRVAEGAEALFGSTTSPQLIVRYKTPRTEFEADSRVDVNFFDRSVYNSTDFHETLQIRRRNERWLAALRGTMDYDTTRTSELSNYGLNLPKVRRTRLGVAPQLAFRPNERDAWLLNASVMDSSYDQRAYTDYHVYAASPAYEHKFNAYNKGTLSLNAQRYETQSGVALTSDSVGPSLGWTSQLTEQFTVRLAAGVERTLKRGDAIHGEETDWDYVYSGGFSYKGNRDTLETTATRAQEPFGNGTETLLTSLSVSERHSINPNLALTARALYQSADYSAPTTVNFDHGLTLGAGASYTLAENADLDASYQFRQEHLTRIHSPVEQHVVMLGVTIHPSWSRK